MRQKTPKLIVLGGLMNGLEFYINKPEITIGRGDDQDVWLPLDQVVSRCHALLIVDESGYWLEDVSSKYGTFVDGSDYKVEGRVKIRPGTTFKVGPHTTLKLVLEDVKKRVDQWIDQLIYKLAGYLTNVPPERWAAFKQQLMTILRRLDKVASEEDIVAQLENAAMVIEEVLGKDLIVDKGLSARKWGGELAAVRDHSPEENLKSLKSFFKSNLNEIIENMEAEESEGV